MQATQFNYRKHQVTIAPLSLPLELGDTIDGYYCVIKDPRGDFLDIDPDSFLSIREDAIAHTKKIIDSITP